jgi:hypothetical protein
MINWAIVKPVWKKSWAIGRARLPNPLETRARRRGSRWANGSALVSASIVCRGMHHRFLEGHLAVREPRPTEVAGSTISITFPSDCLRRW